MQVLLQQISEADSQRKRRELAEHQSGQLSEQLSVTEGNSKVLEDTVHVMSLEVSNCASNPNPNRGHSARDESRSKATA